MSLQAFEAYKYETNKTRQTLNREQKVENGEKTLKEQICGTEL